MINRFLKFIKRKLLPMDILAKEAGVNIGEDNFVSDCFWSTAPYLITIGSHCQITGGVKLFTHGGGQVLRHEDPDFDAFGKVVIGDYVYLGTNSLVMPGVTIGNNVLVAAGSVVTKSVPSGCVIGGNPARIICTIEEYKKKNEEYNLKSKRLCDKEKKQKLLQLENDKFIIKPYMTNK